VSGPRLHLKQSPPYRASTAASGLLLRPQSFPPCPHKLKYALPRRQSIHPLRGHSISPPYQQFGSCRKHGAPENYRAAVKNPHPKPDSDDPLQGFCNSRRAAIATVSFGFFLPDWEKESALSVSRPAPQKKLPGMRFCRMFFFPRRLENIRCFAAIRIEFPGRNSILVIDQASFR